VVRTASIQADREQGRARADARQSRHGVYGLGELGEIDLDARIMLADRYQPRRPPL